MTAERGDTGGSRRSVLPGAANRSLWLAAAWTGAGAAFVCAVAGIVAAAVCWLPAAGAAGNAGSAIHAGMLTFLAALHGGITVDGLHTAFVPLGLPLVVAAVAWRAGTALADAAEDAEEERPRRLVAVVATQLGAFATACGILAACSTLGTSSVGVTRAVVAAALLWLVTGAVAFVRNTALADELADRLPARTGPAVRVAVALIAGYLAVGALLAATSLAIHWHGVVDLTNRLGAGWSTVPVLLLGVLATPNAAVSAAGYLSGPGFAVGSGTVVRLDGAPHGAAPDFPLLAAMPSHPASPAVWLLVAATALLAGGCAAALARRSSPAWREQWRIAGLGVSAAAVIAVVLAWLAGGGIGDAHLATIGVSPWQFGAAILVGGGAATATVLGALSGAALLRRSAPAESEGAQATLAQLSARIGAGARVRAEGARNERTDRRDELAG